MSTDFPGNDVGLGWPATPSQAAPMELVEVPGSDVGLGWAGDENS
ncbi:MAG: hypothetical protein NTZ03_01805 [Actinobacteria bacterium]|nr:hypothetical protein [Actinomycetota bacterium]